MRVCFDTLCFGSSQRVAGDDEPRAIVNSGGGALTVAPTVNGDRRALDETYREIDTNGIMGTPTAMNTDSENCVASATLNNDMQPLVERIRELEALLKQRDQEMLELRSQLDKLQSVFPYQQYARASRTPRKQRAQGISAEPQTSSSLQDLAHQTFPTYDKSDSPQQSLVHRSRIMKKPGKQEKMVVTRNQAANEDEQTQRRVFVDPPRSPTASGPPAPPIGGGPSEPGTYERAELAAATETSQIEPSSATDIPTAASERLQGYTTLPGHSSAPARNTKYVESDRGSTRRNKANSIHSRRSTASVIARMQYEAEKELAFIRRKELQIEAELIKKKLAADIAVLEDDSNDEENPEPPEQLERRVTTWLQDTTAGTEALRGEANDLRAPTLPPAAADADAVAATADAATTSKPEPENTRYRRERTEGFRTRVGWKDSTMERSPRRHDRGIEQLAGVLQKMMTMRPPSRQASDLPVFSGAPTEWLQFKAAYEETTTTFNISPIENLARLRNCLRGEAKEAVAPLLTATTPPDRIVKTLEQCFGRPELIVDRTLEELKKLPKLGGATNELNTFAVKVQNAVTVLKGVKQGYLQNPLLIREILEKLSPHQRSRWYDYAELTMGCSEEPEIALLSQFLMREADRALRHGFCTSLTAKREPLRPQGRLLEQRNRRPVFAVSEDQEAVSPKSQDQSKMRCPSCEQEHQLSKCSKFLEKKIQERWITAKDARVCFKCLAGRHRKINCKAKPCGVNGCKRPHHRLLHDESRVSSTPTASETEETVATTLTTANREVKLKICPVTINGPKGEAKIYALFDEGSTVTLLNDKVAEAIGAEGPYRSLNMQGINTERREANSRLVKINIRGHKGRNYAITARTVKGMNLPNQSIPEELLQLDYLKDLKREELCYEQKQPQILIGSDNWQLIVSRELRMGKQNQPAASRTQLGWVIHGNLPKKIIRQDHEDILHVCITSHQEDLQETVKKHFEIDALGISLKSRTNERDQRAANAFENSARRREDGRYEVGLPWRADDIHLPLSYNNALKRLTNLEHKLDKSPDERQQYEQQIDNLLQKGYAEECDGSEAGSRVTWYLPHFPVKNINKPGKVRLVFDAAAKTHGVCLNDFLLEGPDLLLPLMSILFRFREERIAVKADIQEMFLQVKIRKEDQPAQMFLWRRDRTKPPTPYKMTSMIFGASSSPFLAHSVRNRNALDFAESHPKALKAITEAHYVDDYVDSYPSEEIARETIEEVDYVHKQAGFHLRSWTCNERSTLSSIPEQLRARATEQPITKNELCEKTLGMIWDAANDVMKFNTSLNRVPADVQRLLRPPTKREALSTVMSIYDPLGLLSCYTITAKIELQNLWRQKIDWDEPIPAPSAGAFAQWLRDLEHIKRIELPRSYNGGSPVRNRQLHVFCDASESAYSAAVYWRLEQEDGSVKTILAAAKAKVSPLKTQTIPRLELQAALIGIRLADNVVREHRWNADAVIYWTDAQVVLHWIRNGSRRYTPYVAHRLGEIAEFSSVHQWRWVPTHQNVADLATRSGYVPKSAEDVWYTGPEFLKMPMNEWPQNLTNYEDHEEEQVVLYASDSAPELSCLPEITRFSNYERLIRTTGRVLSVMERIKNKKAVLEVEHLQKAEKLWQRRAQQDKFQAEIELLKKGKTVPRSSPLYRLDPTYEDGLLKLKGRIGAAQVPVETKKPIILDGRHPFTRLLIMYEHRKAGHGNRERVVNDLNQKYWILKLRPTVRSVTKDCTFCRLRRANPRTPPMGDLPKERLGAFQRPFSNCGLDYFGPMTVTIGRRHEKRWGALFTCLTMRAIHIELVASLSTDSALMAIRRMAARRGWPAVMYSDNGTNFKGADVELRRAAEEWAPELQQLGLQHRMKWKYTPPGAPNQGGAWERMVRSVKTALQVTLNEKFPKEEVLQTLLAEAEYSVNARPLTHVSVDQDDPEALTPNHFLIGSSTGLPTTGACELTDRRAWRTANALADEFWRRWVREYLPTLVSRRGNPRNLRPLAVGDLVIVVDPLLPRNTWPRGVVERVYPGPDEHVRSADVRTTSGVFRRPTSKLAMLEAAGAKDADQDKEILPLSP